MVSLGGGQDGRHVGRQGGFFFNEHEPSILQSPEDEELLITQNLQAEEEPHFKRCSTLWMVALQVVLITAYLAASAVLPYAIEPCVNRNATRAEQLEDAFVYLAFSHPVVWLLLLLADRFLQYRHTLLRRHGYLDFTQKTRYLRRTAEFVFSLGNAFMLTIVLLRYKFMSQVSSVKPVGTASIHGVNYQEMIIGVESIIALFCCARYAMLVYKFNKAELPPDAEQEEQMIAVMQPSTHLPDIGYRDSQYVEALLERQADMIRYLKHHTEYLSKRILKLRASQKDGRLMGSVQV
ncbi:transmembrane protein 192-like [Acanthaster planci]|uniref:Transmembrane protein 192 n=1 Tax=Acanthaster planci TaxID=133434 RepID=A0A8B8A4B2_ACAPL|nr:transmembrane protein 192-like [Acanthaster planci]